MLSFIGSLTTEESMLESVDTLRFPWSVEVVGDVRNLSDDSLHIVNTYNYLERAKEEIVILEKEKDQLIDYLGK